MANADTKFGFRTNVHQAGGCPARMNVYNIPTGQATSIFTGDLVRSIVDSVGAGTAQGLAAIQRGIGVADTVLNLLGPFAGCQYVDSAGNIVFAPFWPGGTALATGTLCTAWVYDDPALEMIAQMTTFALSDSNANYDFTAGTGSTVTGRSGSDINQADTTDPKIRVYGLAQVGDNGVTPSELGAFAKVRCRIINHERGSVLTTAF